MRRLVPALFIVAAIAAGTASATSINPNFADTTFAASTVDLEVCEATDFHVLPAPPTGVAWVEPLAGANILDSAFGVLAVQFENLSCDADGKLLDISFLSAADSVLSGTPACIYNLGTNSEAPAAGACDPGLLNTGAPVIITQDEACDTGSIVLGACGTTIADRTVLYVETGLVLNGDTVNLITPVNLDIEQIDDIDMVIYETNTSSPSGP